MTCETCGFFEEDAQRPWPRRGYCGRFPPTVVVQDSVVRHIWPEVSVDARCGEYEPNGLWLGSDGSK